MSGEDQVLFLVDGMKDPIYRVEELQHKLAKSFSPHAIYTPSHKLSFDQPLAITTSRPFKRRRALSDVDGDRSEGRKKRRLRLHLITSRLSRPFSQPASNIANRGISKIAIWGAKTNSLGKNGLRRVAVMNRVRKRMTAAEDYLRIEQEKIQATMALREIVIQNPRCYEFPLPPSPLGLSNYDALDLEDEDEFKESQKDEVGRGSAIYSDFNIMNPDTDCGEDDYGYLDALDGISLQDLPDMPPAVPEAAIGDLLRETERHAENIFVRL